MKLFPKIVNGIQPLTTLTKRSILVDSQGYDYTFISHKKFDFSLCRFLPLLNSVLSLNKRCLHSSKKPHEITLKYYLMNSQNLVSVNMLV